MERARDLSVTALSAAAKMRGGEIMSGIDALGDAVRGLIFLYVRREGANHLHRRSGKMPPPGPAPVSERRVGVKGDVGDGGGSNRIQISGGMCVCVGGRCS